MFTLLFANLCTYLATNLINFIKVGIHTKLTCTCDYYFVGNQYRTASTARQVQWKGFAAVQVFTFPSAKDAI